MHRNQTALPEQRPIATAAASSQAHPASPPAKSNWLAHAAWALAAATAVILLARKFRDLRFEDALITLRYGRNIAEGHGWVFNQGEQVLGVSSPLQTLIAALACWLSEVHAVAIVNALGAIFLVAAAGLTGVLVSRCSGRGPGWVAALLCVSNFGLNHLYLGMELPLFALLVLASVLCLDDLAKGKGIRPGALLGLAFLTRHDAALLVLLIALSNVRRFPRAVATMLAASALLALPWLLFAWASFGSPLATPLAAKEGHTMAPDYGAFVGNYVYGMFKDLGARVFFAQRAADLFAVAAAALTAGGVVLLLRRPATRLLILFGAAQVLVYAWIGADPAFTWHYYLLHTIIWSAFAVGLAGVVNSLPRSTGASRVLFAAVIVMLGTAFLKAMTRPYQPAPLSRDMHHVAHWIDRRYLDRTSLLTPSIGIFGWVTNLTIVDHAGLITPGLYYWDDDRKTPIANVIAAHRPDLILILDAEPRYIYAPGYRLRKAFRTQTPYVLYERVDFPTELRTQPSGSSISMRPPQSVKQASYPWVQWETSAGLHRSGFMQNPPPCARQNWNSRSRHS